MSERAAPFYCPYCGEEDLRPSEAGHGAWECADCNRAFRLSFLGLLASGIARAAAPVPREGDGGGADGS
ncbi:hypothetical protein [Streptomyces triticirhizae]|uniref:IS1 family transposase n=1 Tax=Streptomyces triticirhizae TaxID=2483353 RepID=A0A3M2LW83_9ACTN|nr:hypothetical protein [Streptomyces triticirhizae]RMI41741.1 hypothetical protein EBN88_10485 [Streptomyces triticirhizae]